MYRIIGVDEQEYGPVGGDELRQWILEGRANAQSRVRAEESVEWRALASFPEFAANLAGAVPVTPPALPIFAVSGRPSTGKTNSMAIAGFVCSLAGVPCCFLVPSILGLAFSCVALVQIHRQPQRRGKSLAVAGIIISILALLLWAAVWIVFAIQAVQDGGPISGINE